MRKLVTTVLAVVALTAFVESRLHLNSHSLPSLPPSAASSPVEQDPPAAGGTAPPTPVGVLPNPRLTPGAVATTDAYTVCHRSTRFIRPPAAYTGALKREQLATDGYADRNPADYEEDHLIPLELGGDPTSARNLWPEPRLIYPGATQKDAVENALHEQVCAGTIALTVAQHEISTNWYAVWLKLGRP